MAGQGLLRSLDRRSSMKLYIPAGWREEEWKRAQQWHDYNCTWLGQNLGNEVCEEYRAVAGRVYQAGQPDDVWLEDTLRLILPREISKLESIRAQLPLWTPRAEPAQEPIAEEVHRALLSAHPALLADVLLNWIHTSAGGSPSAMVACDAFEPDIARAAIEEVLRTLESRGYIQLHWINPTRALPGATLTQSGAVHAESGYKRWRSRVFRDRAARNALLTWLHDEGGQNGPMPLPGFLRDPRSAIDGRFFSAADRDAGFGLTTAQWSDLRRTPAIQRLSCAHGRCTCGYGPVRFLPAMMRFQESPRTIRVRHPSPGYHPRRTRCPSGRG